MTRAAYPYTNFHTQGSMQIAEHVAGDTFVLTPREDACIAFLCSASQDGGYG
jgi:hypothetical protein